MVLEGRVGGMAGIDAGNGLTTIAEGIVDVVVLEMVGGMLTGAFAKYVGNGQ